MNLDQGVQVIDLFGLLRRRGKLIAIVAFFAGLGGLHIAGTKARFEGRQIAAG